MNKLLAILPMRGGSKGLPNKHLQKVFGKSLAQITVETVKKELGDNIFFIVSTDSQEIANECTKFVDIVDIRPIELGQDYVSIEKVLKYTAKKYGDGYEFGLYLSACDISRPLGLLSYTYDYLKNNNYDSIFWGEYTHKKYWETIVEPPSLVKGIEAPYKPRQKESKSRVLIEHTGLGLFTRVEYWIQELRHCGTRKILELPEDYRHVDIHSIMDIKIAETYLKNSTALIK
tara:strand:+ start:33 stop:725 length:693 start_codon:yes stop_codon:yes gene_type:complete